mmetsp:Transcript_30725/g.39680  ORF Transcript_30725/g.39680 Transcript_30725/m.39680 type:complete len:504 (+) Transcript_30725:245-1756(+)
MSDHQQNKTQRNNEQKIQLDEHSSSPSLASGGRGSIPPSEQQPAMRSVAINPAASQHRTLLFNPPLKRVDPGTTAMAPLKTTMPTSTAKQPPQYVDTRPMITRKSLSDPLIGAATKWNVQHSNLKARPSPTPTTPCALPPPQKCTSRLVKHTSTDIISGRIAMTLQARSIKAKYSKSAAKCRTLDFVKFYIRLYVVPGDDGGVLVELQRVSGDYLSFMYDCRAILDAAEGKDVIMESNEYNSKAMYLRLPVSQMSFACNDDIVLEHDLKTTQDEEDIINITSELLSSPQSDSNMLGMESLVSLVDANLTSKSTAILAAKRLVCTRHESGNGPFSLHNYAMSLIIYEDDHENDDDDDSSLEEDATSLSMKVSLNRSIAEHTRRLRTHALMALSNALDLLNSEKILCDTISASKEWYASVLIPSLIDNVKSASSKPYDATLAARCLTSLAMCSKVFASTMKNSEGCKNAGGGCLSALESAGQIGRDEFELLLRDVERCQSTLLGC